MGTHKSYKHISHHKFYHDHQPIFITSDIENIMLVTHIIG